MSRQPKLRLPPSGITGPVRDYFHEVHRVVNALPTFSFFSGSFPSSVTGVAGDMAVNVAVASNVSRLFIHVGSASLPDKTSWNTVA